MLFEAKVNNDDLAEIVNKNLNEAVFRCTDQGEILYVNNAFITLFKVSDPSSVLGKKARFFYKDESYVQIVTEYFKKPHKTYVGEVEFKKQDGGVFYGRLSARLINKTDEKFIDGVIQDISGERTSQIELERQANIQEIVLDISSSFLDADLDDIYGVIVKSLCKVGLFIGTDRIHVHDYDFNEGKCTVSHEWTAKGIPSTIDEHHEMPIGLLHDMVVAHEKGQHVFFPSVSSLPESPVKDVLVAQNIKSTLTVPMKLNGKCVGFISLDSVNKVTLGYPDNSISMLKLIANMIANLSVRAKGHLHLKKLIEQVTLQSKQHKDFSFITSHNVRASVANLIAITRLMKDEFSEKYLEMLSVTVNKLSDSMNNINSILQLDHYELLKHKICNFRDSINKVIASFGTVIAEKDLKIENSVPKSLLLNSLPSFLDNIFYHLISNAIKYGTTETAKRIVITGERLSGRVEIKIIDFGDGFDMTRHAHRIFEVGARFDKKSTDGQGLGLYITKQQIESLGGKVEVQSSIGIGTTVRLSFPLS